MENRFTQKAQNALILAVNQAQDLGHTYIGSEHLLLGLIEEKDSVASRMLYKRGIVYSKIKKDILEHTDSGTRTSLSSQNLTPRVRKIIENSSKLSEKNKQSAIGSEHLLYSLLGENDCLAVRVLEQNGLYVHEMKSDILAFIQTSQKPQRTSDGKKKDDKSLGIEHFGKNLNELAVRGVLDPTLCREKETERVIQILCRRTKNNPCLIGEPGVGKTAVVEGLAGRISSGNVPPILKNKVIYSLDISSLIAGAKYRGEFEDRMKNVMRECIENKNIILFIDEIHTIIGAGSAEGAIDAANILKPALARGEIQVVGATTISEYRKHIEKDSALERRFQPVTINEPSAEQTRKILYGLRSKYEEHHNLNISDEAISGAVELSQKYINDRYLPDKAIDLVDEAASRVKIERFSKEEELDEIEKEINDLLSQKEEAILHKNIENAKSIGKKQAELESKKKGLEAINKSKKEPTESVGYEDIARVVTDWTGIPVTRLLEGESNKLLTLEKELKKRIIGQERAIELISQAIRRGRVGLKQNDQPTGSFIFVGPSGVGKTELCLSLSELLFGSRDALIRFDMSEYMEKHSVSRLIGAPPGYVGYGEGGLLTEKVRKRPYCVLLFDEIEKAHPEIFNLMLQILEDGSLTDAQGRRISFKNSLIVMTSNLGSPQTSGASNLGFFTPDDSATKTRERKKKIKDALERTFKPEFLNRIDEIVIFNALSKEDIERICSIMLTRLSESMRKLGISIEFDDSVKKKIVENAFDERSGARKLRREIRNLIENPIASKLLSREIAAGDCIRATVQHGQIEFIK